MQTGIFHWFGYRLPIRESLKMIAAAGFDNITFWWGDQFKEDYDEPKEKFPELARTIGLQVENIHADDEPVNFLWEDKSDGKDALKKFLGDIDTCYNHQIPVMVLHFTKGLTPPPPSGLGLERIKQLVERAEQKNVTLAIENVRHLKHLDFVFQQIQSDKLRFCYDSGHDNCFTPNQNTLEKFGSQVTALHLHDNDGTDDQHRIPGEGTISWDKVVSVLKQNHFHGSITLEVTNESPLHKNISPEQFLAEAYQGARKLADQFNS